MRLFVSFYVIFLLLVMGCGSDGAGGGSSSGGGAAGGGGGGLAGGGVIPGLGGNGANAGGDPVVPGSGGENGGGGGDDGGDDDDDDGGGGDPDTPGYSFLSLVVPALGGVSVAQFEGTRDSDGRLQLTLDISNLNAVPLGVLSIQSAVFSRGSEAFFTERFETQGGVVLADTADRPFKSLAMVYTDRSSIVNSFSYPTRGRDLALQLGRYAQSLQSIGGASEDFAGRIVIKNDSNLRSGRLLVNLFLIGQPVVADQALILDSIDILAGIYSSIGITLDLQIYPRPLEQPNLPDPSLGNALYERTSQSITGRAGAVNVFIGSQITLDTKRPLGLSSSIPGPYFPSSRSAVVIDFELHEGLDGFLNERERTLLGETIGHEVGHYLGLFHPVEAEEVADTVTFSGEDPLGDTPTCTSLESCRATGLTTNLMFPTPVDVSQRNFTPEQADVIHIQPFVN